MVQLSKSPLIIQTFATKTAERLSGTLCAAFLLLPSLGKTCPDKPIEDAKAPGYPGEVEILDDVPALAGPAVDATVEWDAPLVRALGPDSIERIISSQKLSHFSSQNYT